ncbi:MAG: GMP synthase [Chitinophagaceae bacterium]|nr:GMP synthase [Chitinophagaceae bacterium]
MNSSEKPVVRLAILDLYNGVENQGMRGLQEIIGNFNQNNDVHLDLDIFNVRQKLELPGLDYDIYISSGGPGSPIDSKGEEWDTKYFNWLETVDNHNIASDPELKKPAFFICHSFQLACRHFKVGVLSKRKSNSFGVFPVHMLEDGEREEVFKGLTNPFYAVDSRDYQVIEPDYARIKQLGSKILAIEKERPHIPLQRAMMAIRFTDSFIGTQFHPEADPVGMLKHLHTPERKKSIIENHGYAKWKSMVEQLPDPGKIRLTYTTVLPNFLKMAVNKITQVPAV